MSSYSTSGMLSSSFAALALICSAAGAVSAAPPSLPLLRPDSLVGWDSSAASGWSISGSVLTATEGASALRGQWDFRFGTLSFAWRGSDGASLAVELLDQNGDRAALLSADGGAPNEQGWRRTEISLGETGAAVWPVFRTFGRVEIRDLTWSPDEEGEPLFNGENLDGWWTPGNQAAWVVDDGELLCTGDGGNYLRTDREYGDFVFSFSYRMERGTNSGVGIRTPREAWPSGDGMELQIYEVPMERPVDKHSTMAIYGNIEPLARAERIGEWNDVVIAAEGPIIAAWVNGVLVQHADVRRFSELQYRNGAGWIGFQDHGARIRFRDLRLAGDEGRSIAPEDEPTRIAERSSAWRARSEVAGSESSAYEVLDAVLNSGRLTDPTRPSGKTLDLRIGQRWEVIPGPAAVVRVDAVHEAGLIEFFVDGEAAPSISGFADQLHDRLPVVGEDVAPLLTWLPFRESLRVRAGNMTSPNLRIAYVALPEDEPDATFAGPDFDIPRGILSAAAYRYHQLGHGTRRRIDPMEHATPFADGLAPGESLMLEASGSGTVRTLAFSGDVESLLADGVTLKVETKDPANRSVWRVDVDVPMHVLFPCLRDDAWYNFVATRRDQECATLLAMPFTDGLRITLTNGGKQTLQGVGIDAAIDRRPSAQGLSARLRLASDEGAVLELSGAGRMAGVVAEVGDYEPSIVSVTPDGEAAPCYELFWPPASAGKSSLSGWSDGLAWEWTLLASPAWREGCRIAADPGDSGPATLHAFYYEVPADVRPAN